MKIRRPRSYIYYFFCMHIIVCLCSEPVYAQNPGWWHLTDQDGLPGLTVHDIVQDDDGYMWMATNGGLCRFDGRDFKVYDDLGFQDNEILKLNRDINNRLWFSNITGELSYFENDSLYRFDRNDTGKVVTNFWNVDKGILTATKIKSSKFCIAYHTSNENGRFEIRDSVHFNLYTTEIFCPLIESPTADYLLFFIRDHKYGVVELKDEKLSLSFVKENIDDLRLKNVFPPDVYPSLFAGRKSLYTIDSGDLIHENNYESDTLLNYFRLTGEEFVSKKNGYVLRKKEDSDEIEKFNFLRNVYINTIAKDREGNYWIGTNNQGVYVIPNFKLRYFDQEDGSLLENYIYDIDGDNDQVYVAQESGGLTIFSKEAKVLQRKSLDITFALRSIYLDAKSKYFGLGNKVVAYNNDSRILPEASKFDSMETRALKKITGHNDDIFIANAFGVTKYSKNKSFDKQSLNWIHNKRTYGLAVDKGGTLWIGSIDGLYRYKDNVVEKFISEGLQNDFNASNIVISQDGSIWASLNNLGLIRINEGQVQEAFSLENGLSSNTCRAITTDQDTLWIGTNKGVDKLVIGQGIVAHMDISSGLISNDITSVFTTDSDIWIGTHKGLSVVPRSSFVNSKQTPSNLISEILINGVAVDYDQNLNLSYRQNDIEIGYCGFSYASRGKETYQYRLLGLDSTWHSTSNRSISFYGLPHGEFIFETFAVSSNQVKSENVSSVYFTINQLWWKKWWVQCIGFLCLIALIVFVLKTRQSRLLAAERKEQRFQKRIEQIKMQALQSQMNPHFVFNTLNGIQDFLLSGSKEKAISSLSDFSRMISFIFENSAKKLVSLSNVLEFIDHYLALEKMRFEDKISIDFEVAKSIKSREFEIYLPPLLIQPIIENAFQHGLHHRLTKSTLTIEVDESEKSDVKFTIVDSGVGRQRSKEIQAKSVQAHSKRSTSGLKIVKERIAIFHGIDIVEVDKYIKFTDLFKDSNEPAGTKVEIWL